MSNNTQEIFNYTGSTLLTLECILSGLADQIAKTHGSEALAEAHSYALKKAASHPGGPIKPDVEAISRFFSGLK